MADYHFKNLIFEGGGVLGLAYVGALDVLEEKDILKDVKRIGGASAGAINALLLSLGYSNSDLKEILINLNFNNFLDDSWGIVRDSKRLVDKFGWYKGNFFRNWIRDLIEAKTGNKHSTFKDFKDAGFKELFLIGSNLSTGYSEIFSHEHTPTTRVADAVRISMSIPLFFQAMRDFRQDVFVDGGLLDNYPVKLFDRNKYVDGNKDKNCRETSYYEETNEALDITKKKDKCVYNKETLGFRLDKEEEILMFRDGAVPQSTEIDDFFDYIMALFKTVMNVQNNQHLHTDDWHRTIYINTKGVSWLDFDLDDQSKELLIERGIEGTKKYFKWYDKKNPRPKPKNHPDTN